MYTWFICCLIPEINCNSTIIIKLIQKRTIIFLAHKKKGQSDAGTSNRYTQTLIIHICRPKFDRFRQFAATEDKPQLPFNNFFVHIQATKIRIKLRMKEIHIRAVIKSEMRRKWFHKFTCDMMIMMMMIYWIEQSKDNKKRTVLLKAKT